MIDVDNSPLRFVKIYKVFHPRPIIYCFNQNGLMHFASAAKFDCEYGKYESNKRCEIRKCDVLYLREYQREPVREIRTCDIGPVQMDLSVSSETLMRIIAHHILTTPGNSFESRDLRLFFENENGALSDAKRVFENCDRQKFATLFDRLLPTAAPRQSSH